MGNDKEKVYTKVHAERFWDTLYIINHEVIDQNNTIGHQQT